MHETKARLIIKYGLRCMLCNKELELNEVYWHHIVPKYVSKANGELPDDSEKNGSLLCKKCHIEVHKYDWLEDQYQVITSMIENYKEHFKEG